MFVVGADPEHAACTSPSAADQPLVDVHTQSMPLSVPINNRLVCGARGGTGRQPRSRRCWPLLHLQTSKALLIAPAAYWSITSAYLVRLPLLPAVGSVNKMRGGSFAVCVASSSTQSDVVRPGKGGLAAHTATELITTL